MSSEVRQALADLLRSIPVQLEDPDPDASARRLLDRLDGEGWTRVGLAEDLGGTGGDIGAAAAVIAACAASGHLLPVSDMVISARLVELAQLPLGANLQCPLVVAAEGRSDPRGRLTVRGSRVPWARLASHLLVLHVDADGGAALGVVDASGVEIEHGRNFVGEPRDSVVREARPPMVAASLNMSMPEAALQLRLVGALVRSMQCAAAIERIVELAVAHCMARHQFGKRLVDFQAVQQHLAALRAEASAAAAAVDHALSRVGGPGERLPTAPIATAKVRTALAAGSAARLAHQVHGAIGIALEYPLQSYTRALWSWRDEFGNEHEWGSTLVSALAATAAGPTWESLTAV